MNSPPDRRFPLLPWEGPFSPISLPSNPWSGKPLEKLHLLLSFAVGGLLGDVFLHLLPEAWAHINAGDHSKQMTVGLWVLVGIFSFMLIEKVFPDDAPEGADSVTQQKTNTSHTDGYEMCRDCLHKRNHSHQRVLRSPLENKNSNSNCFYCQHDHKNGSTVVNNGCSNNGTTKQHIGEYGSSSEARNLCSKQHIKTSGWLNLFANAIDNFTHGLAVAGSYCVGTKTGMLTTLAILLHELPHEVGDFAILLRSGFNRWQAAKAQLITASGALIGALTALIAESAQEAGDRTAWILPFTAGGFIYIALVSVVPELMKETNWRESLKQILLLCSGIIVMALVTYLSD
ncbi:Zinc transporter ZIP13 [Lamellibrachia satsuma]|nr:Zinc transporter ZIP13 [Lamellibrachia satsuma]